MVTKYSSTNRKPNRRILSMSLRKIGIQKLYKNINDCIIYHSFLTPVAQLGLEQKDALTTLLAWSSSSRGDALILQAHFLGFFYKYACNLSLNANPHR